MTEEEEFWVDKGFPLTPASSASWLLISCWGGAGSGPCR